MSESGMRLSVSTNNTINNLKIAQPTKDRERLSLIYFDAKGRYTDGAVKGGYYRQIMAQPSLDTYIVQDFYEVGGLKRTDPMQLTASQLTQFNAIPINGILTIYATDGTILQQ